MNEAHLSTMRAAHARVFGVSWFTVSRGTRTADDAGGQTIEWHTVSSGNGTIKQTRASKQAASERLLNQSGVTLMCAYDTDVTAGDRVVAKGVTYDVLSVDIDSDELLVRSVILESR